MVEHHLAERGISVFHPSIRTWAVISGHQSAADIRHRSARLFADKKHLDEVVIAILLCVSPFFIVVLLLSDGLIDEKCVQTG